MGASRKAAQVALESSIGEFSLDSAVLPELIIVDPHPSLRFELRAGDMDELELMQEEAEADFRASCMSARNSREARQMDDFWF